MPEVFAALGATSMKMAITQRLIPPMTALLAMFQVVSWSAEHKSIGDMTAEELKAYLHSEKSPRGSISGNELLPAGAAQPVESSESISRQGKLIEDSGDEAMGFAKNFPIKFGPPGSVIPAVAISRDLRLTRHVPETVEQKLMMVNLLAIEVDMDLLRQGLMEQSEFWRRHSLRWSALASGLRVYKVTCYSPVQVLGKPDMEIRFLVNLGRKNQTIKPLTFAAWGVLDAKGAVSWGRDHDDSTYADSDVSWAAPTFGVDGLLVRHPGAESPGASHPLKEGAHAVAGKNAAQEAQRKAEFERAVARRISLIESGNFGAAWDMVGRRMQSQIGRLSEYAGPLVRWIRNGGRLLGSRVLEVSVIGERGHAKVSSRQFDPFGGERIVLQRETWEFQNGEWKIEALNVLRSDAGDTIKNLQPDVANPQELAHAQDTASRLKEVNDEREGKKQETELLIRLFGACPKNPAGGLQNDCLEFDAALARYETKFAPRGENGCAYLWYECRTLLKFSLDQCELVENWKQTYPSCR